MTNSDETPQASRMSYQDFSDAAPFGRYNLTDFQSWPLSNDALTRHFMPIWFFFHLHIHSIVLDAFLQHFYHKFRFEKIDEGIQSILKISLNFFCISQPHSTFQSVTSLSQSVDELYNSIVNGIKRRYCAFIDNGAYRDFNDALRNFIDTITADFATLRANLSIIQSDTALSYDMMQSCLSILQRKHEMGWKLASAFFAYGDDKTIPMSMVIPKLVNQYVGNLDYPERFKGEALKTLNSAPGFPRGERYIRFTFSPFTFLWQELLRLPLEFFHEYISHLDECIYPPSHTKPSEDDMMIMDEGWMMYVAESFFARKGAELLSDLPRDLITQMETVLKGWTHNLTNYDKNKSDFYKKDADLGHDVAEKFLKDFLYELPDMEKKEANELFYHLSFDLITRTPEEPRWHSIFIETVNTCLTSHKEELIEIASQYRDMRDKGSSIHVGDFFWSQMKHYRPTSYISRIMS